MNEALKVLMERRDALAEQVRDAEREAEIAESKLDGAVQKVQIAKELYAVFEEAVKKLS